MDVAALARLRPRWALPAVLAMTLGACAGVSGETPGASQLEPGRPYAPEDVLAELRESAAEGRWYEGMGKGFQGLDPVLVDLRLAELIAGSLHTFDGEPYRDWRIWGGCEGDIELLLCPEIPSKFRLAIFGIPSFAEGREHGGEGTDVHAWEVDFERRQVARDDSGQLHGYPEGLDGELDTLARGVAGGRLTRAAEFTWAEWMPPPNYGEFAVEYYEPATGSYDRFVVDLSLESLVRIETQRP